MLDPRQSFALCTSCGKMNARINAAGKKKRVRFRIQTSLGPYA
jgi:hypothetical protein